MKRASCAIAATTLKRPLLLMLVVSAAGCGAILGLEEKLPPEDADTRPADAGADRRTEDVILTPVDGGAEGAPLDDGGDGGPPTIDCLGVRRNAFFCDGFEGVALDSVWTQTLLPSAPPAELSSTTNRKIGGTRSLASGFTTLPDGGTARLGWSRPSGAGPLAMQLSIFWADDSWPVSGSMAPIASFTFAGGKRAQLIWRQTVEAAGNLELDVDGQPSLALGPVKVEDWTCIELYADGTKVRAWSGSSEKLPAVPITAFATAVEFGLIYLYGPNAGASKFMHVDDVVLAPGPIGCLH